MRLIPAIDLIDGRCVRLFKGDYAAVTHYETSAAELLAAYAGYGAQWIHVVDLDGARDGRRVNQALIAQLTGNANPHAPGAAGAAPAANAAPPLAAGAAPLAAKTAPRLQVGGGIRSAEAIEAMLAAGVGRVVIGSAALTDAAAVAGWIGDFGKERIVLAMDVRQRAGAWRIATHGWKNQTDVDLWDAVAGFTAHGLLHVLCTDVGRDGAMSGPNLELYTEAVRRFPRIQWQASGGIRHGADLHALAATGAAAAISGKALLENRISAEEMAAFLPDA